MSCHFLLQGIFPTQGLNPGLLHWRQTLQPLSHQGRLYIHISALFFFFNLHVLKVIVSLRIYVIVLTLLLVILTLIISWGGNFRVFGFFLILRECNWYISFVRHTSCNRKQLYSLLSPSELPHGHALPCPPSTGEWAGCSTHACFLEPFPETLRFEIWGGTQAVGILKLPGDAQAQPGLRATAPVKIKI